MRESNQPTKAEALEALDVLESVKEVAVAAIDGAGLQWPGATRNDVATVRRYIEQAGADWQPMCEWMDIETAPKDGSVILTYCALFGYQICYLPPAPKPETTDD